SVTAVPGTWTPKVSFLPPLRSRYLHPTTGKQRLHHLPSHKNPSLHHHILQGLRPPKVRFRPRPRPAGPDTGETRANGALLRLSFANTHSSTPRRPAHFELAISLLVIPLALWPQTPPAMGSSDLD
ncbi:hypothetical protein CABS03_10411, partial [Colletotrichum abscissum]